MAKIQASTRSDYSAAEKHDCITREIVRCKREIKQSKTDQAHNNLRLDILRSIARDYHPDKGVSK